MAIELGYGMALCLSQLTCVLLLATLDSLCLWSYLLFPILLLAIKLTGTCIGLVRALFIYKSAPSSSSYVTIGVLLLLLISTLLAYAPMSTILRGVQPPLLTACQGGGQVSPSDDDDEDFAFLHVYLVVGTNAVFVDVMAYAAIFNYMRRNAVRVTVLPVSRAEQRKTVNLITAPSSFLLLLVTVVAMLPPTLLSIRQV